MATLHWEDLTPVEQELMICASEASGALTYACESVDSDGQRVSNQAIAALVLDLVDRGLIEVCRFVPWVSPDGRDGLAKGQTIPPAELTRVLADPLTWVDLDDWLGAVALRRAARGETVRSRSAQD